MPTPNDAPKFNDSTPETAAAAGEHHYRMTISALGALEALHKQYGPSVARLYQESVQALEAEALAIERKFEGDSEPEGLAPAA